MIIADKIRDATYEATPNTHSRRGNFGEIEYSIVRTDSLFLGEINILEMLGSGGGVTQGELIDKSGSIISGGTSQQVSPANGNRNYFLFQNQSDTDMWIDFAVAATNDSPSIKLQSGDVLKFTDFIPTQSINVFCSATGKKFAAKEG